MAHSEYFTLRTLGFDLAVNLGKNAAAVALEKGISGVIIVKNSLGLLEYAQAVGDPHQVTPVNVEIAEAKLTTVLHYRRSTSLQKARMLAKGQDRADFAGQLGSLFGGGVPIFADFHKGDFVGGIAFSGGTEQQDEAICRKAIWKSGLRSDLGQPLIINSRLQDAVEETRNDLFFGHCLSCGTDNIEVVFSGLTDEEGARGIDELFGSHKLNLTSRELKDILPIDEKEVAKGVRYLFEKPWVFDFRACRQHRRIVESLYGNVFGYSQVLPEMIEEALQS